MSAHRVDMHRLQDMVRLHRLGTGSREVARLLKMGPNTERQYRMALQAAGLLDGDAEELPSAEELRAAVLAHAPPKPARQQRSSIEPYRAEIERWLEAGKQPQSIHDTLRLSHNDYAGSLGAVKRMVARIKRERGPQAEDVAIPVETAPGEVAQVDFGYAGRRFDGATGQLRKSWVFVMTLGFSRHQYAEVVFDQSSSTWLGLHVRAFRHFGGVPEAIVPDNLKAAVVRAAFGVHDAVALNRGYRELARHFRFKVDPTPPRSPEKKGKVEAGVRYVKHNFLRGRDGEGLDEVNAELQRWVREIAGQRIHGTTRKRPLEVFEAEERASLLPLPARPYESVEWKKATVHRDSHIAFGRRLYSVPWRLLGREVWVRATPATVAIYFDDERVATHRRAGSGPRSTDDGHLPPERAALRHRSRDYWENRAAKMGDEVGGFIREVFDSDDVLSQLRQVQAIVTHLEKYPVSRARAACVRASYYGSTSYQAIKNILLKALDLDPLLNRPVAAQFADAPRFARDPSSFALDGGRDEHH